MTKSILTLTAATAAAFAALSGAAVADHRNHDDHSKHTAQQHAEMSSGPAKAVDAFAVALASKNEKLVDKLLAEDVLIAEGGGAEQNSFIIYGKPTIAVANSSTQNYINRGRRNSNCVFLSDSF